MGRLAEGVTCLFIVDVGQITLSQVRPTNAAHYRPQESNMARPAEPLGKVPLHLANLSPLEAGQAPGAT